MRFAVPEDLPALERLEETGSGRSAGDMTWFDRGMRNGMTPKKSPPSDLFSLSIVNSMFLFFFLGRVPLPVHCPKTRTRQMKASPGGHAGDRLEAAHARAKRRPGALDGCYP